jgi:hypothetical protein
MSLLPSEAATLGRLWSAAISIGYFGSPSILSALFMRQMDSRAPVGEKRRSSWLPAVVARMAP